MEALTEGDFYALLDFLRENYSVPDLEAIRAPIIATFPGKGAPVPRMPLAIEREGKRLAVRLLWRGSKSRRAPRLPCRPRARCRRGWASRAMRPRFRAALRIAAREKDGDSRSTRWFLHITSERGGWGHVHSSQFLFH